MDDVAKVAAGWFWPLNSRKAHWFGDDGRSLCGKWMTFSKERDSSEGTSKDDCAECSRKAVRAHILENGDG